jgi:hypothetical protein
MPNGPRFPEAGTLSADGSRRWDGRFWVPIRTDRPLDEFPPAYARPDARELPSERRGFRLGGVVFAALVVPVITFIPIPVPNPGSLDVALSELAFVTNMRVLVASAAVVVILSIGRQGIDVLLLRAMLTAFIVGAAFVVLILAAFFFLFPFPIPITPRLPWPLAILAVGLIWAVLLGPPIAAVAALANLLWYRSLRSLRPQLRVFNRRSKKV